jgi:hypothetical protein
MLAIPPFGVPVPWLLETGALEASSREAEVLRSGNEAGRKP